MTCEQALEAISAALDGELSDAEKEELEAHLTSCPDCRALWDDLRTIQEDAWESVLEPPEGFHDRVMAAVAEEPAVRAGQPKKRHAWKGWGGLAAVAAVVILIAGPGLRSGMSGSGGNGGAAPAMAEVLSDEAMGDAPEEPAVPEGQSEPEDVGMYDMSMSELGAAPTGRAASDRNESAAAPEEEAPQSQMQMFANKSVEGAAQGYRAVVTVAGGLPAEYSWDEDGQLVLAAEELEALKAALEEAGISYTVQDSGEGIEADGSWILVLPNG